MKTKILLLLGILSFFTACSQKRILFQELTKAGRLIYHNSKPFTGIGFSLHFNNKIKQEIEFKNGKEDGKQIEYYKNGKLRSLYTYKENIKHGIAEFYDENGDLIRKGNFKDGKADGQWVGWVNYGIVDAGPPVYVKSLFVNGSRMGLSIYYSKSNQEIARAIYLNGELVEGDTEEDIINPKGKIERLAQEKLEIENHLKKIKEYEREDSIFKLKEKMSNKTGTEKSNESGEILTDGDTEPLPQRRFKNPPVSIDSFKKLQKQERMVIKKSGILFIPI